MADQKISQLTSLTGANTASGDLVTVVDISDTTMGASGTNKKMTLAEFQASPVSAGTANGVVYLNGTKVPSSGSVLTFDGTYFNANGLRLAGADVTNTIYQATGALGISTGSASGIIFSPNATARMALDASGNLGVGTVSPASRLHSYAGTNISANHAIFGDSAIGYWNFSSGGSPSNRVIARGYDSSAVENIRLDPSSDSFLLGGNLGIGTASPGVKLDVNGAARILAGSALYFQNAAANTNATISCTGGSGNNTMSFNSGAMLLDASGNLGLNTSTFGTSAAGVLSLGTGTAPTTGPADTVQLFSVDRSAGNTIPAIRCEGSGVTNAGITSTAVTNKIAVQVNGTIYYLLATTNAT